MIGLSEAEGKLRHLVLASGSPRRRDLLKEAGLEFDIDPPEVEELEAGALPPVELATTNARLKACTVAARRPADLVLGSDTVVVFEEKVYGKPRDLDEAFENLSRFSGQVHQVITAVSLMEGERVVDFCERAFVKFRELSEAEIKAYLRDVPVLDKAGGYAAQEEGARIIESIEGDFNTVIGLPVARVLEKLEELNFPLPL